MSAQTNPIDVLAVIDWAAEQVIARAACASDANRFNTADQLRRSRAAIAKLIEAAREASATLGHIYHTTPLRPDLEQHAHDGYQRLDAAIKGVSPPKAEPRCDHSWAVKSVTGGLVKVCQLCGRVPPDGAIANVSGGAA